MSHARKAYKTRKFKREFKRATIESLPYLGLIVFLCVFLFTVNNLRG